MRLVAVGDAAVLAQLDVGADGEPPGLDGTDAVLALALELRGRRHPGVIDVVPAERSVLVRFDPRRSTSAAIARWIRGIEVPPWRLAAGPLVELDVRYDGEDLPEVAALTGLSVDGVIDAHTGQDWVVAFSGFAPGFGYLRGLAASADGQALQVPRRDEPRVAVPAGSVALAAGYSGVYPRASPGGWQLIGRTDTLLWDADRDPPAVLQPGTRVRFRRLA